MARELDCRSATRKQLAPLERLEEECHMFCYQCEQTVKGTGCTKKGVCGKDDETAALQDLLIHAAKGIANYAHRAARLGASDDEVDLFVTEALFTTVTNVSFDTERLVGNLKKAGRVLGKAKELYQGAVKAAGGELEELSGAAAWSPAGDKDGLLVQAEGVSIANRLSVRGQDVAGLEELCLYGLKGVAAYADHAQVLGVSKPEVYAFFHEVLDFLTGEPSLDELVGMALRVGEVNLEVMGLLDGANTGTYGHPEPTVVRVEPVPGKAILVSGHDLKDLKELLEQTEGKGINIYTHGEMLPAHGYPYLKKHAHLVGNYGGAWQDQRKEFESFPGSILMTTNCIQRPKEGYQARIFTTGLVSWPGVKHIGDAKDFSAVIEAAQAAEGFAEAGGDQTITVGFGHNAVMSVADKVIDGVKSGAIKRFFLIGGCDGAKSGRNYYTRLAEAVPDDCVVLTLACGKYRFNKLEFGDIGGIPRLLDIGQCNDAYSAIQIAAALANAFDTDVNGLPLSMVLSWYEQKAVCILLTLLHLGIKNIRIGPSLPAFIGPSVLGVLVEKFGLTPIGEVDEDLEKMLAA